MYQTSNRLNHGNPLHSCKQSSGTVHTYPGLPPIAELILEAKTCLVNMVWKCPMIVNRFCCNRCCKSSAMNKPEKRPGKAHIKKNPDLFTSSLFFKLKKKSHLIIVETMVNRPVISISLFLDPIYSHRLLLFHQTLRSYLDSGSR